MRRTFQEYIKPANHDDSRLEEEELVPINKQVNQTENKTNYYNLEIVQNGDETNNDLTLEDEEFIINKTKNYTCYICGKSFESVSNLMQHLILLHFKHDIINQFYLKDDLGCPICKKPFLEKSCLIIHLGSDHQAILKYIPKFLHNVFYPETKALEKGTIICYLLSDAAQIELWPTVKKYLTGNRPPPCACGLGSMPHSYAAALARL